jgi:hypothetical protein
VRLTLDVPHPAVSLVWRDSSGQWPENALWVQVSKGMG